MVKAQEYLSQNYSDKEIKELNLTKQNLEGSLIIKDFPNLETIRYGSNNLTSVKLINLPKLKFFNANSNQLTSLTVNNCPNITEFNVANNLLTDTSFLNNLNPENLNCLSIHSNDFSEQDLSFLSNFTNLERLFIDNNDSKKFSEGKYNRFTGSLQPLQSLVNLKWLSIANTNVNSGLEYLPENFKKICLINSWEQKKIGYLEIKREMEKSVRLPKVTEKLQEIEKDEPSFAKDWYRIAPWKQARKEHREEVFKKQEAQDWLNENYSPHTNLQHYKELDLRDQNLIGMLDLSNFIGLEKLDCSYNRLTSLDLSKCGNLTEFYYGNNEFSSLDFLQALPNKEKLEVLVIEKNRNLAPQNLDFLKKFTNLHILDISDNEFIGSLEPLKNMKKLRLLDISRTDIEGGLEYLADSCRGLYCDPDCKKKSTKIVNILAKYLVEKNEEKEYFKEEKYFNLVKWREELRSNIILSIPTERLFVIRSNIKKFIEKWSKEIDKDWYERFRQNFNNLRGRETKNLNELGNLQSPEQFSKQWYWTVPQWAGRGVVGVSGILGITGNLSFGSHQIGVIAVVSPVFETITSYAKKNWYEDKEKQWAEFTQDAKEFLDNYHELKGMLESLRGYKVGTVDQALKDLDDKSEAFLTRYDEDGNGNIDISELKDNKDILAQNLNQLGDIFQAMIKLENEINKYRRGFYYGTTEEEKETKTQNASEKNIETLEINEKEEYQSQIEIPIE